MSDILVESAAMHIIRRLARNSSIAGTRGTSVRNLLHWWTISLGQSSDRFELGLDYAGKRLWVERSPTDLLILTTEGAAVCRDP